MTSKQMTITFQEADEVQFEITGSETVTIDWGDGSPCETHTLSSESKSTQSCWHLYPDKSNYTVTVTGGNITEFRCSEEKLVNLDVSRNTALTDLDINDCKIRSLDLSKNTAMEYLLCSANCLTDIDVRKCTALKILSCVENQLTFLDVSKNIALEA